MQKVFPLTPLVTDRRPCHASVPPRTRKPDTPEKPSERKPSLFTPLHIGWLFYTRLKRCILPSPSCKRPRQCLFSFASFFTRLFLSPTFFPTFWSTNTPSQKFWPQETKETPFRLFPFPIPYKKWPSAFIRFRSHRRMARNRPSLCFFSKTRVSPKPLP